MILETERLGLRKIVSADAPFILELVNDPDWLKNIGDRGVRTLDDAAEFIAEGPLASYSRHGYGLWLAELRDDHTPVGMCGVLKRSNLRYPDLGYALLPAFRGAGYAIEACRGVLEYARTDLGIETAMAIVAPANAKSIKLLEKLSFGGAGTVLMPGQSEEVLLFQRTLVQNQAQDQANE
ncbi:MAG: GNAT family N-acetyltransferase [Gammaproteobacteria bacterium]|nr:GNAT family N-acetyltransferase [Gammaproteobacteria bacterium]